MYLNVQKKENNLTPYEIISDGKKHTLSQETNIQISEKIKKVEREKINTPIKILLHWKNLTKNQECG